MKQASRRLAAALAGLCATFAQGCSVAPTPAPAPAYGTTFAAMGAAAERTLTHVLYAGGGRWRMCTAPGCAASNGDWGAAALTGALYARAKSTNLAAFETVFAELARTLPAHAACIVPACTAWSDIPEWDAVAAARVYDVTHSSRALQRARAAYASVERSTVYSLGACPAIRYQRPRGGGGGLKTLETDANAVKAALLLARVTGDAAYVRAARGRYAAIRRYFLDPRVPLYTVYVLDDGARCTQVPHRFFASVNGDMIWDGLALAAATGDASYRREALATAEAVARDLADARGVFANLQAENDVAEPLVEAMVAVAREPGGAFARAWILRTAAAAIGARRIDGTYGRFADGPVPRAAATAWQTGGNLALAVDAAVLDPAGRPEPANAWERARAYAIDLRHFPARFAFHGSGVALLGTIGERCCEDGHARVMVDGHETFDRSGIWQNKSSSNRALPGGVLFAWRWPGAGDHSVELLPAPYNPKEGGAYVHVRTELVLP